VILYIETKIAVSVSDLTPVPEGFAFTFVVTATNASVAEGGIALRNVRYQVRVLLGGGVRVVVPSAGASIDGHGHPIAANSQVEFFSFDPSDANLSFLQPGGSHGITVTGVRPPGEGGFNIAASILADPDIDNLFPRNFRSSIGERSFQIF